MRLDPLPVSTLTPPTGPFEPAGRSIMTVSSPCRVSIARGCVLLMGHEAIFKEPVVGSPS